MNRLVVRRKHPAGDYVHSRNHDLYRDYPPGAKKQNKNSFPYIVSYWQSRTPSRANQTANFHDAHPQSGKKNPGERVLRAKGLWGEKNVRDVINCCVLKTSSFVAVHSADRAAGVGVSRRPSILEIRQTVLSLFQE